MLTTKRRSKCSSVEEESGSSSGIGDCHLAEDFNYDSAGESTITNNDPGFPSKMCFVKVCVY